MKVKNLPHTTYYLLENKTKERYRTHPPTHTTTTTTRGVSHCGLAIYIERYVKAKEEL
jgi:hypothetical protein